MLSSSGARWAPAAIGAAGCFAVVLVAGPTAAAGAVVYSESFGGTSATSLDGVVPTTDGYSGSAGPHTWSAASGFYKADGSVTTGTGNALLPFVPAPGNVYTVSATVNNATTTGTTWLAIGFAASNSFPANHFASATATSGNPWMLLRATRGTDGIQIFGGPSTSQLAGVTSSQIAPTGPVAMRVELDTTPANWTVKWYANDSLLGSGAYTTNPNINFVGLSKNGPVGTFSAFQLTAVPEPTAVGAVALAGLGLLARRRRMNALR